MTDLELDPEKVERHADDHRLVRDDVEAALANPVVQGDGWLYTTTVIGLVEKALREAQSFADTNAVIGVVLDDIARSATMTDEEASDAFGPLGQGLMDL